MSKGVMDLARAAALLIVSVSVLWVAVHGFTFHLTVDNVIKTDNFLSCGQEEGGLPGMSPSMCPGVNR
jgi:hypothetical protein